MLCAFNLSSGATHTQRFIQNTFDELPHVVLYLIFCFLNSLSSILISLSTKCEGHGLSSYVPVSFAPAIALTGLWFRKNDKIQRLLQLVVKGQPDEVGEAIEDTYQDLAVYGVISQIVTRDKWAK